MPSQPTPQEVYDAMIAKLELDRRREKRNVKWGPCPPAERAAIDVRYDYMIATLPMPTEAEIAAVSDA